MSQRGTLLIALQNTVNLMMDVCEAQTRAIDLMKSNNESFSNLDIVSTEFIYNLTKNNLLYYEELLASLDFVETEENPKND